MQKKLLTFSLYNTNMKEKTPNEKGETITNYQQIKKEQQKLEAQVHSIQAQLKALPKGKLIFSRTGKYTKWYQSDGKTKIYIPKKRLHLAEQLAIKKYLQLQLEEVLRDKRLIDQYLHIHDSEHTTAEQFITEDSEYHKLLSHYFQTEFQSEWMNASYEKCTKNPEHLIHKSISGNVVRSKSEVLIDMMLFTNRIPFHYEETLQLGNIILHPDFTIQHPRTGEILYWEHFGKMDDTAYAKNAADKIALYIRHGIIPSIHLITTFETQDEPLTSEKVRQVIEEYFS